MLIVDILAALLHFNLALFICPSVVIGTNEVYLKAIFDKPVVYSPFYGIKRIRATHAIHAVS